MIEEWRPVVGYDGLYEVSNLGRVRSLDRISRQGYKLIGKIRSTPTNGRGYSVICLHSDGVKTMKRVHRLVAESFIGDIGTGLVVDHLNGNPLDNRLENLEIVTQSENTIRGRLCTNSESKSLGVSRAVGGRWVARKNIGGRMTYLGTYNSICDASEAYTLGKRTNKATRKTEEQRKELEK